MYRHPTVVTFLARNLISSKAFSSTGRIIKLITYDLFKDLSMNIKRITSCDKYFILCFNYCILLLIYLKVSGADLCHLAITIAYWVVGCFKGSLKFGYKSTIGCIWKIPSSVLKRSQKPWILLHHCTYNLKEITTGNIFKLLQGIIT